MEQEGDGYSIRESGLARTDYSSYGLNQSLSANLGISSNPYRAALE